MFGPFLHENLLQFSFHQVRNLIIKSTLFLNTCLPKVQTWQTAVQTTNIIWKDVQKGQTYVGHVFWQQILQSLAHSVALCDYSFTSLVTCARWVRHQRSSADDTLQSFLQWRSGTDLIISQWVHYNVFLHIIL